MSDEIPTLVCTLVSKGASKVEGCTIGKCAECGKEVWLSPSSVKMLETREMVLCCLPCCEASVSPDATIEPLNKDQKSELLSGIFGKPTHN